MAGMTKRRWTYVITTIVAAGIVILAVILMQQPIPSSNTPPVRTPPTVSTVAAAGIGQTTATLNGNLSGLGSAATVTVGFRYATSAGLAGATNVTVSTVTATTGFAQDLTGLTANTTYYFAAWANGEGFAAASARSFTTLAQPSPQVRAPTVSTGNVTGIGNSTATLNGKLGGLGTAATVTIGFVYGTSPSLAGGTNLSAGTQSVIGAFSVPVAALTPNTTYYVKAWGQGAGFAAGSIVSFKTAAVPSGGGGGNGNHVPPGWEHASCPEQAVGHGVRARCEFGMTWGEMKKQGLTGSTVEPASVAAPDPKHVSTAALRMADPGNSGDHRSIHARQW